MRLTKTLLANIFCILFVTLCACWYYKANIRYVVPALAGESDFGIYYRAAGDILAGKSPYENPAYFYPPLVGFAMAPLALLNYLAAKWTWFVLSQLFLLGAGVAVWRGMGYSRYALCSVAAMWALGGAAAETLRGGQMSPLLVLVIACAYCQRGRLQGIFVSAGFVLKYIPGILGVTLLLQRRWRSLSTCAALSLAGVAIPWLVISRWFAGVRAPVNAHYWMGTPAMFSWSIPSMVLRAFVPAHRAAALPVEWEFGNVASTLHLTSALEWLSVGAALATLAVGILALAWACRWRLNEEQVPWAMAALVSLSLAAGPVCWTHYQILQYPGAAMLLAAALERKAWRTAAAVALCFALTYRWPELALVAYKDTYGGWTAYSPATLYFWTSVPTLAGLGLFGIAVAYVHAVRAQPVPERERVVLPMREAVPRMVQVI